MRKNDAKLLDDILAKVIRMEGLETPLNQYRIVAAWTEVMGEAIGKYTGEVKVENQVLLVKIKSPALRQTLMYQRQELVKKLNNHVKAQVIVDIKFI